MPGTDEPQIALGRAVKKLREERGLSPQALADRADIDVAHLEAIESGEGDTARWRTVAWIAQAMDTSLREVAGSAEGLVDDE